MITRPTALGYCATAAAKALLEEAIRPKAIDTSNGLFELIREIHRLGAEDGQRSMASRGGNARATKTVLERKIKRLSVYADYFQCKGRRARAHPYTQDMLAELKAALETRQIKASIATIRADIAEWRRTERNPQPATYPGRATMLAQ